LNAAHGEAPHMSHDVDDDHNDLVEGAADNMRTSVDAVAPDMLLRIDANPQHKMRGDDTRERGRCGHQERDDHLKPRRLFNVCAAEGRAYHHTRNRSRAHETHSIDGRLKSKAQPFNCEMITVHKVRRAWEFDAVCAIEFAQDIA